jgi:hypothetical protein
MRRRQKLKHLRTMSAAGMIFVALIILLVVSQRVFQMVRRAALIGEATALIA